MKVGWLAGLAVALTVLVSSPCINYAYGKPGDLSAEGETLPGWKQNVVSFELGVTFH